VHGLAVTPLGHASWMRPRDELLERGEPLALGVAENERGVVVNGRLCVVAMRCRDDRNSTRWRASLFGIDQRLQLRLAEHRPDPLLVDALGELGCALEMIWTRCIVDEHVGRLSRCS
jgi:hypothetical protein